MERRQVLEQHLGARAVRGVEVDLPDLQQRKIAPVSYTHLRAHETVLDLVCRLLLEKKKHNTTKRENGIKSVV